MATIKILTCIHKDDIYLKDKDYLPIQVGKALASCDLHIQGDDSGDHISAKNPSYCELTALYWAWKNLKDIDYIGLCHYRRYFDFHRQGRKGFPCTLFPTGECEGKDIRIPADILTRLEEGCVIMPKPMTLQLSLFNDYCVTHVSDDLRTLERLVKSDGDPTFSQAFDDVMYYSHKLRPCNMFIMGWSGFDRYCQWLFGILEKVEKETHIEYYSPYQKRIYGFMAERLLNVYLRARGLKTFEVPLLFFCDQPDEDLSLPLGKYRYRNLLKGLSFLFSFSPKYWGRLIADKQL